MAEEQEVGISVIANGATKLLRFTLQASHLEKLNSERLDLQRQADGGFLIIPGTEGFKPQKGALENGAMYIQTINLGKFALTKKTRKRINLRPSFENGNMVIPPPPKEWCDASGDFGTAKGRRSDAAPRPTNIKSDIEELQAQIERAKELFAQIEARTGIKITLDRDLRLVVAGR
jgi:hypothetical protein